MEALRIKGLSKNFGGVLAVKNVSFCTETGEHLAIIGPNGAGKTTLFNLLNGQLTPSGGRVYLFGKNVTNMAAHQRAHLGLARSFQLINLFLNLTLLQNAVLALHGMRSSRFQMFRLDTSYNDIYAEADKLLDSVGLLHRKDEPVRAMSYGEQRKLEIILSLASNPKVLLLDEPSCGLTSEESAELTGWIRNLRRDISIILIAHDMDLVFDFADRIIVLHYGEIIVQGTPSEIQSDPKVQEIYMGSGV